MTLSCFLIISIKLIQHANSRFASDIEMNNSSLYFLDKKFVRENNKFTTSVYCKSTFSDAFAKFESFVPNSYKYALTFPHRALKLCFNFKLFHKEIENSKNFFKMNR